MPNLITKLTNELSSILTVLSMTPEESYVNIVLVQRAMNRIIKGHIKLVKQQNEKKLLTIVDLCEQMSEEERNKVLKPFLALFRLFALEEAT